MLEKLNKKMFWPTWFYDRGKLRNQLYVILFVIVFIICSISFIAFQVVLHIYNRQLYNESATILNLYTNSIENELQRIENTSYIIMADPNIQEQLRLIKLSGDEFIKHQASTRLRDILSTYALSESYFASINIIDSNNNQIQVGLDNHLNKERNMEILDEAVSYGGRNLWISPSAEDNYLVSTRVIRQIHNLTLEYLGLLIIRIDMNKFINQFFNGDDNTEICMQIFSSENNIYSTGDLTLDWEEELLHFGTENHTIKTIDRQKYFISFTVADYTGWTYVNLIRYDRIYQKIVMMRNIMLVIHAGLFGLSLLLGLRFANNITKPIENLAVKMRQVEKEDFNINIGESMNQTTVEEIKNLYHDFETMVYKINNLIKENYSKQILLKDTRYKALQAQINPHFLYNTLDTINWTARVNRQEQISVMVEALANLMRRSISKGDIITIGEDIEILKNYLTIQKIRYEERLVFQLDVDDKLLGYSIPKLTLQPVVENAVNYGLEKTIGVCNIKVEAKEEEGKIKIIIEDNGPGMEPEFLDKLRRGKVKTAGSGIGLKNIDERIKITYGDSYGLFLASKPSRGTRVTICIPAQVNEGRDQIV